MRVGSLFARHGLTPLRRRRRAGRRRRPRRRPAAANREHQQMMADIRMLQEQNQQLQQSIGTLVDALKTVDHQARRAGGDDPQDRRRSEAADRRPVRRAAHRAREDRRHATCGSARWRRKSTRCATRSRRCRRRRRGRSERAAGRHAGLAHRARRRAAARRPTPPPVAAAGPPPTPPPACRRRGCGTWRYSDYAAGQWPLAIQGFETYMRAFPRSEQADDAQFYIGEAYQLDGKMREALAAYERVVGRLSRRATARRLRTTSAASSTTR